MAGRSSVMVLRAGWAASTVFLRLLQDTCRRGAPAGGAVCGVCPGNNPGGCRWFGTGLCQGCAVLAQGKPAAGRHRLRVGVRAPWTALSLALWLALAAPVAAARCTGLPQPLQALAPGVWWLPGATGEAQAGNRGQVSTVVLVRQDQGVAARLWALGSGPSPAWGRALACQVRRQLGGRVTDVISPWARPELVLGVAGLQQAARGGPGAPALRHWAHAVVAEAMAAQCPHCVDRLRLRLGTAAADLGADPIRVPDQLLQGEQGRLGPFDWWRLPRSAGRWVTVWRLAADGQPALWLAHGLLQGEGPPDGRDASLALLQQSAQRLAALALADGPAARFVGEQGPLLAATAPAVHARYWTDLRAAAEAAVLRGDDETAPAPAWPGLPDGWAAQPWHALNWQRAWRQAEAEVLALPPDAAGTPAPRP